MDYEELFNMSGSYSDDDIPPSMSNLYIVRETLFMIYFFVGALANIAIIYTLLHFQKMQSVPNIFIANWAIADLCYLVVTPSTTHVLSVLTHFTLNEEFLCILEQFGSTSHIAITLFVIIVTIDWFLAAYFEGASEKCRKYYRYLIASVWIITMVITSICSGLCIKVGYMKYYADLAFVPVILYLVMLLLPIICQCSRAVQKCRRRPLNYSTLVLTVLTVFVVCSLLSLLFHVLSHVMRLHSVFAIALVCFHYSTSIVNLTLLYWLDKDFHVCLLQVLKCSSHKYEDLTGGYGNSVRGTEDGVKILFSKNQEMENMH